MAPLQLTAKKKGSFAYLTIKDRLPVINTKVIDHLCREKINICKEYGQEVADEIKDIVGQLSQLKNEMQTNKLFTKLPDDSKVTDADDDIDIWNSKLELYCKECNEEPRWFVTSWLYAECYFFRRVHNAFVRSEILKSYDPFHHQKKESCYSSLENFKLLSSYLFKVIKSADRTEESNKTFLMEMLEISLWGNQCDLCISSGDVVQQGDLLSKLEGMRQNIIASDQEEFWKHLISLPNENKKLAIIMDNAGLELFSDFCLAALMIKLRFVCSVVFYTKIRPWFVSDTTLSDINWTLGYLREQGGDLAKLSQIFSNFFETGIWKIREHKFWTGPHSFPEMRKEDPELYAELSQYSVLIFKGDLNYRKLVGDLDWPNKTRFRCSLGGFLPAPLLSLRTIKGGPVVGLNEAAAKVKRLKAKEGWDICGEVGMIQFASSTKWFDKEVSLWVVTTGLSIFLISFLLKKFVFVD